MRFSTFIFRNVLRRRIRSTLTIIGMAVAVIAVVVLVGLANGLSKSMLKLYVDRGVSLIVTKADAVNPLTGTLPVTVATETEKLDGVVATCAGLVEFMTIEECGSDPIGVQGWPLGTYMFNELTIISGKKLSDQNSGRKEVVVGSALANVKKLQSGQTITLADEKFYIVGVFETSQDLENGMVIMLLPDAQKIFGKTGLMTGCTVKVKDPSEAGVAAVRAEIEGPVAEKCGLKGKIRAKPPGEFVKQNAQVRLFLAFALVVSFVTLVISGILVLNTMFMAVFERTREIGILRAIGWRPSRVMLMILLESILLSVGGGIVGTLVGLGVIKLLGYVPMVSGIVQQAISVDIVIKGFAIAIIVGLIGAAYPAYRGSRLLPTEALRHE
ncbi:MAG: FtsX-like permease family protein [Planctomycetota bacterium]